MMTICMEMISVERIVYDQNTVRCGMDMAANRLRSLITVIDL
jgi:hypothetical protein